MAIISALALLGFCVSFVAAQDFMLRASNPQELAMLGFFVASLAAQDLALEAPRPPEARSNLRRTASAPDLRRPRDFWRHDKKALLQVQSNKSVSNDSSCSSHRTPVSSKCTGCPPMYKGKPCASTTWYEDTTKGSCGCGDKEHVDDDFWTLTQFTAAINCVNLDEEDPAQSWCPLNCGHCYEICSTGGATTTQGVPTPEGVCKVFKVTNRCGDGWDVNQPDWCSQRVSWKECSGQPGSCDDLGSTNRFGYPAHFDLQDFHRQITTGLGWDNSEVTFERVSCDRWTGPSNATCAGCQG
ncbi:unnamed protein product [Polarella glacialis]|uniref:Cellulase n=1 Tax=Polarella glacialis TaxID=89957 RepID=A0A813FZ03_POLGL|nr:unnamed protein product [Polarella glacialis]